MIIFELFRDFTLKISYLDLMTMVLFIAGIIGYRSFLSIMLRRKPVRLFLGKLQQYRTAWLKSHIGGQHGIVVVQTMRNSIIVASFLASTSIILIAGALNALFMLNKANEAAQLAELSANAAPSIIVFKILLIVIILSYSFFNFTWSIREINYLSLIVNIPVEQIKEIDGADAFDLIAKRHMKSGIFFSLGIRGYYFLIPLLMWFFSSILAMMSVILVLVILVRRDLRH